jgi:hypothetical protein
VKGRRLSLHRAQAGPWDAVCGVLRRGGVGVDVRARAWARHPGAFAEEKAFLAAIAGEADRLLATGRLAPHEVRLVRDADIEDPERYTAATGRGPGGARNVDPVLVRALWSEGSTVVVESSQRFIRESSLLACALAVETRCPAQANLYLTPAESQGFGAHADAHDVLIFQLAGRKAWTLGERVADEELATRRHRAADRTITNGTEVVMEVGDVLYIPRGIVHQAKATDLGPSTHLTLGIHWPIAGELEGSVLERLVAWGALRQSVEPAVGAPPAIAEADGAAALRFELDRRLAAAPVGIPLLEPGARAVPAGPLRLSVPFVGLEEEAERCVLWMSGSRLELPSDLFDEVDGVLAEAAAGTLAADDLALVAEDLLDLGVLTSVDRPSPTVLA